MRQRLILSAVFGLLIGLLPSPVGALESGVYRTLPGATVVESGDRVPNRSRVVPITATLTFDLSATPPSMTAVISNAVLEGGDPFALTVRSSSGSKLTDGTYRFAGDYLQDIYPAGTQYGFDWRFSTSTNGDVTWYGLAAWLGGHDWRVLVLNLPLLPPAQLSIAPAGNAAVQISWPSNFSDYSLEYATDLSAPAWSPVTNPVSTSGDRLSVTVEAGSSQRFFRLRRP